MWDRVSCTHGDVSLRCSVQPVKLTQDSHHEQHHWFYNSVNQKMAAWQPHQSLLETHAHIHTTTTSIKNYQPQFSGLLKTQHMDEPVRCTYQQWSSQMFRPHRFTSLQLETCKYEMIKSRTSVSFQLVSPNSEENPSFTEECVGEKTLFSSLGLGWQDAVSCVSVAQWRRRACACWTHLGCFREEVSPCLDRLFSPPETGWMRNTHFLRNYCRRICCSLTGLLCLRIIQIIKTCSFIHCVIV